MPIPSDDPYRISFVSNEPIKVVCIDWENIPLP